jgi:hypothetical protein
MAAAAGSDLSRNLNRFLEALLGEAEMHSRAPSTVMLQYLQAVHRGGWE